MRRSFCVTVLLRNSILSQQQAELVPMSLRKIFNRVAFAGLAMTAAMSAVPTSASAQGLFEFLWGGTEEYGGGRQSVGFSPQYAPGQIIVSFGDRRLYHITSRGQATSYPIAVPRQQSRWQGVTSVSMKRENPSWTPTAEMRRENPRLPNYVPGGHPLNPLGVRALYLGSSTYRIHGTDAPWTIGQAVSKGCIRMYNEDVLHLYPRIPTGTRVTVTWQKFKTGSGVANYSDDYDDEQVEQRPKKYYKRTIKVRPKPTAAVSSSNSAL
jgi:lipoprotein-anchoring transpeptidase ErfK/SrfK